MKNALQEQLLKAGLVTQDQVKAANRKPKPKKRKPSKATKQPRQPTNDLAKAYAAREAAEQQEARRAREQAAKRKRQRAQLRKLIQDNTLNDPAAELPYQFVVGSNVKKVHTTAEQRQLLLDGRLAITFLDGKRCIVSEDIALQIRGLDPKKIIIQANPDALQEDASDIPDDLIW